MNSDIFSESSMVIFLEENAKSILKLVRIFATKGRRYSQ
jgi:hypothetical protein